MKKNLYLAIIGTGLTVFAAQNTQAQTVSETIVAEEVVTTNVPCKTHYYSDASDNWFIQLGAGVNSPFVENYLPGKDKHHELSVVYNVGFGKWFSPYLGWRLSFLGGPIHWNNHRFSKAKYVNANLDFMWDMFNSLGGVNSKRVFSVIPFVGLGGTFAWDYDAVASNCYKDGKVKSNQWTLPVSAGIQLRFRLCRYVDFFAEGRAQFYGDNFNNCVYGDPVDVNLSVIGGFSFNIGGAGFKAYNPCDYLGYINSLNGQVNDLRASLARTQADLAAAQAQLPCPEVVETTTTTVVENTPVMATVRFKLNSAVINPEEEVNVFNVAQWMKANPEANVAIVGYADKDTGTSEYNMQLSRRRAQAVYDDLTNDYGVNPDRLSIQAEGSNTQPYDVNNWNRIVIFVTQ